MMEAIRSSEASVLTGATLRHIFFIVREKLMQVVAIASRDCNITGSCGSNMLRLSENNEENFSSES
jgi:hypothetical protein